MVFMLETSKSRKALSIQTPATVKHAVQCSQNGKVEWKHNSCKRSRTSTSGLFASDWSRKVTLTSHGLVMAYPGVERWMTLRLECLWYGKGNAQSEKMLVASGMETRQSTAVRGITY